MTHKHQNAVSYLSNDTLIEIFCAWVLPEQQNVQAYANNGTHYQTTALHYGIILQGKIFVFTYKKKGTTRRITIDFLAWSSGENL